MAALVAQEVSEDWPVHAAGIVATTERPAVRAMAVPVDLAVTSVAEPVALGLGTESAEPKVRPGTPVPPSPVGSERRAAAAAGMAAEDLAFQKCQMVAVEVAEAPGLSVASSV